MRGYPITRDDERGRPLGVHALRRRGSHPFVHALDTVGREAMCIDLDALAGARDLYDLRLDLGDGGGALVVRDGAAIVTDDRPGDAPSVRRQPARRRAPRNERTGGPASVDRHRVDRRRAADRGRLRPRGAAPPGVSAGSAGGA